MTEVSARGLSRAALPTVAAVTFLLGVGTAIAVSGDTLGYDYQAYAQAANRLLHGQALYDASAAVAGPFAVYLYPPPFAVAFIPFALLPAGVGTWLWVLGSAAMVAAAIALMPVRLAVRWWVLLLAGLDWPVVYAVKLGQVGPLLLLAFVVGWRWLAADRIVGLVGAVGTLVKLQPGLVLAWAALAGRWRAVAIGAGVVIVVALVTLPVVGVGAWADYVDIVRRVSAPVTTPRNLTVGAALFQAGLDEGVAAVVQVAAVAGVLIAWIVAARRRSPEVGFVVTIIASQMLSPLLWDHYAIFLLLPTALLLQAGRRWAVVIPLLTNTVLMTVLTGPAAAAPVLAAFAVGLVGPIVAVRAAMDVADASRSVGSAPA